MQQDTSTPSIDYTDLELAFHFASAGDMYDSGAYICRKSGKIYYLSPDLDDEDDVPDNLADGDLYAQIPGQRDLDLGKPLVLEFAARSLSDNYEKVASMFQRRGAYSNYREFLFECGKLDREWGGTTIKTTVFITVPEKDK